MKDLDTSRLGDWLDLPFFGDDLNDIETRISQDDRVILPPPALRFRALELTQPGDVRAVILGQDPYHTPGKADGLAFSIPDGFGGRLAALGNIFKEMEQDLGQTRRRTDLTDLAQQGVLLLNTALTVPEGIAGGHAPLGWDRLTRQVITRTAQRPTAFVLWGAAARALAPGPEGHLIVTSAHPSPLSAHRGFFGSRPFSTVNRWLKDRGETDIDWTGQP